jgi:hypothetical protein
VALRVARGLFRLWVFASVVWVTSWGAYVWLTRLEGPITLQDTGEKLEGFLAFHTDFGTGWKELSRFTFGDYASLVSIAFGIPLAVLVLGWGARWVIAGFTRIP